MKTWKELDFTAQLPYIRQAEYLHEKGHFTNIDSYVLAEMLYMREQRNTK